MRRQTVVGRLDGPIFGCDVVSRGSDGIPPSRPQGFIGEKPEIRTSQRIQDCIRDVADVEIEGKIFNGGVNPQIARLERGDPAG